MVVWEAGFHYLQGMLLQLAVLGCVVRWVRSGRVGWVWASVALYLPALGTLEVFYLTPLYAALVLGWYRWQGGLEAARFRRGLAVLVMPQLALCGVQYGLYRWLYGRPVPHVGQVHAAWALDYARKPAKYLFHVFLGGRYWPESVRSGAYRVLNALPFLVLFYGGAAVLLVWIWKRRAELSKAAAAAVLFGAFAAGAVALVLPLYFHHAGYVYFDRYTYFLLPPAGVLLGLAVRTVPRFRGLLAAGILLTHAALLSGTVRLWRRSDALTRSMLQALPPAPPGTTTVLLNLPNALQGVPMAGMAREGEAALMRRYVLHDPFPGALYEPTACNLRSEADPVPRVTAIGQGLHVTLPSGLGWWTGGIPTTDWENEAFRVHVADPTCCYELLLKAPPEQYRLLRWTGGAWQPVTPGR